LNSAKDAQQCLTVYTHSKNKRMLVSTLAGLEPTPPKGIDF
jgi:hypothetical protein